MQTLTYDCRNRLTKAGDITYSYDAENNRIATTEDGLTTEYVYDTSGSLSQLLVAYEPDSTSTIYVYGAEGLAGQYNTGTKKSLFYHFDNIGSTTMLTDLTGKVIDRIAYGTYGELLTDVKTAVRFLYNGAYGVMTDSNGLYYMRARYYNPDIKRFINQDVKVGDISNSQSLNRYAYCEGNPVSLVDPFGLCPKDPTNIFSAVAHVVLGWGGNLEGIGIVFDLADAGLSFAEGDKVGGYLSLTCAIPFVGVPTGVARGAKRVEQLSDYAKTIFKNSDNLAKSADEIAEVADDARKLLHNDIPQELAPLCLGGDDVANLVNKGEDVFDQVSDVAKHYDEDIYTTAKRLEDGNICNDVVEITLKYKEGMPIKEFERKANTLKELGDRGLLRKAANPVKRNPKITREYRQSMIKRIWNQYGDNNPEFANKLIDRITTRMQPDHVWELQLDGPDTISNLRFLDSYTNWDIGTQQIYPQIKNLDVGTKIKIRIEGIN